MFEIVFDIFMVALLLLTVSFCWRLNGKLAELKGSRNELKHLLSTLDNSVNAAHNGIRELQELSGDATEKLAGDIKKAQMISDDLSFLVKTGNDIANKIEEGIVAVQDFETSHRYRAPESYERDSNLGQDLRQEIEGDGRETRHYSRDAREREKNPKKNKVSQRNVMRRKVSKRKEW